MNPYLADVAAAMVPPIYNPEEHPDPAPPPAAPPPQPLTAAPVTGPMLTEQDAAKFMSAPVQHDWQPTDPLANKALPANQPGAGAMNGYDPLLDKAPTQMGDALMTQGVTTGPPAALAGGTPTPDVNAVAPANADPNEMPYTAVGGGGVTPAHEVDLRGPSLKAAQVNANDANAGAAQSILERTQSTAAADYQMALEQERDARLRENAQQQSAAEQQQDLQQRQDDFDQSVHEMAQQAWQPDGGFWGSRSAGQKFSGLVGLALGGFLQGARGGTNPGLDAINTAIDRYVRVQEAQYNAKRDVVNGRQTAFGMAMQKYGNDRAARAMATAAGQAAVQAQLQQSQSLWKGTDAANRADIAMSALQQDKMNQIAQGVKFVLPTQAGRIFVDKYGLRHTEQEMKAIVAKQGEYGQQRELVGLNTAGHIAEEDEKAALAKDKPDKAAEDNQRAYDVQSGYLDGAAQRLVGDVPGSTTAKSSLLSHAPVMTDARKYNEEVNNYNTQVDGIISHWAKKNAEGKIPIEEYRRLADRMEITPDTPDEAKAQRIRNTRIYVDESAKVIGVKTAGEVKPASPAGKLPPSAILHGKK